MTNLYALLIGIDFYFPNRLPDGGSYTSLNGCVRDIRLVEEYLLNRLRLAPGHILKLSASNSGGAQPAEPPEQWPTYENMVAQFRQLAGMAQPGDQVYIHFAGHGGRAKTIFPQLKGEQGLDEALVPSDIGKPEARYLRDIELAYLLEEMVKQGLVVTLVLDSCHSGGATRGLVARVRGIPSVDSAARPADSLVAPVEVLAAFWQQRGGGATRALKPEVGWLLEPKGYTLLAACRASESAYEYAADGQETHGALTYWLLDTLRLAGSGVSYKMLHDRILAKVHGVFEQQTPQLQGEGNRTVFGSDQMTPAFAVPVMQINLSRDQVRLGAGEAQGIQLGAKFAIYPSAAAAAQAAPGPGGRPAPPVAVVEVTRLADVDAWAAVAPGENLGTIEEGAQAVLLASSTVQLQRGVKVAIDDGSLRQQVEQAIAEAGKGFVTIAGADQQVDFLVAANAQGEFELWDPAETALPTLRPALRVAEPGALSRLVGRLVHLAKYRNVQALEMPDPTAMQWLQVELASETAAGSADETPVFRPGDRVTLKITNLQAPGTANDPAHILNITVLDLQPDWGISQVYPDGAAAFEPLDPGQKIELAFEAHLPDGYDAGTDILKVFATQATTQFRWLELPVLDQPPDSHRQSLRSAIADPLEQLLASVTAEQTTTRNLKLSAATQPRRRWTVAQLELRVQR
jgi:hypothetical protein